MLSASGPSGSGSRLLEPFRLVSSGNSAAGDETATENSESADSVDWQYFDERAYIDAKRVKKGEDPYGRNKFNQIASDKLASNRVIPDTRSAQCNAREWSENLPETSVIITFHNEARSTLLRTIVR